MRAAIDRDHARFVNHFVEDGHVAGRLHDLIGVVVAGGEHAGGHAARDAAVPDAHVLPGIGDVGGIVIALRFRGGLERHSAIGRIHYERGLPGGDNLSAGIEPDLVVVADVACGRRTIHAIRRGLLLEFGGFFFRQHRFVGEFGGTLERSDGGVGPDSFEIGLAVCGAGGSPGFERLLFRGLTGQRNRRQRGDGECEGEIAVAHMKPPVS